MSENRATGIQNSHTSGSILTSGTKKDGDDYKIHLSKMAGEATINGKAVNSATITYVILK